MSQQQHKVIISLAANCDPEKNLAKARECLSRILSDTNYTRELWTEPFSAPHSSPLYLNQLVYATTCLGDEQLVGELKDIEKALGRTAEDRRQGRVRIDLDLMQYDEARHHLRDWDRPYIKALLLLA
ncbi:MAG: 2-amino-4-hydroxy-6-hydroxymethyldihydropteridine diphosphokinase [Prevotella sp.]|nr:2-amino-4-hydroxy-6-hydroxymethyldihydropteridine diphosphokinase [Prevotella sp.]